MILIYSYKGGERAANQLSEVTSQYNYFYKFSQSNYSKHTYDIIEIPNFSLIKKKRHQLVWPS